MSEKPPYQRQADWLGAFLNPAKTPKTVEPTHRMPEARVHGGKAWLSTVAPGANNVPKPRVASSPAYTPPTPTGVVPNTPKKSVAVYGARQQGPLAGIKNLSSIPK